ncbi:MAG TPA: AAA family ATPase [Gaiellaceae bacterium]|nr:AAA family ATPase [Gaiellaceae bacterium]
MADLLEREAELADLEAAVQRLGDGRGRLVLLGGEAGIGKTALVRELRTRVGPRVRVLVGACEPLSVPVPLAPLRELARAAGGPEPAELGSGDRLQLADRLLDVLREYAPAVAVVEDAHWADPATLDVVRLLGRRVEQAPVVLIVTYRDDEVDANPDLRRLLGDLATWSDVRRLTLRPLSREAVRTLATPAGVDATRLARVTGGNPFLVVESIAAGGALPATVRDAALARAARLRPAAREAVGAAAAIGQRVDPALLETVHPGSAGSVEDALARGVLVADGNLLGFRHELIREAIEASIAPPRRAELHARIVAALTARGDPLDHARLAHHAELAGLDDVAARHASLAAAEAERVGALREAALQAERALRLGVRLEETERLELLLRHSRAANFASIRMEDAAESAEEAIELASRTRDRVRLGRGLVALAWALWSLDRVERARQAAEEAVAVLDDAGDTPELARAQATRVRLEATAFDPALALALGPTALDLAERAGLEQTRIGVEISMGLARGHRGDAGALSALAQTARAARAAGLSIETVRTYVNLVYTAMMLRRHAVVDDAASEALALFDDYQTTIPANAVQLYRARSLLDRGRWEEAEATLALPEREWAAEAPLVPVLRGLLAARRGEPGGAEAVEAGWAALRDVPESSRHGTVRVALVESAWLCGDHRRAAQHLRDALGSPTMGFARPAADLAVWGRRLGIAADPPTNAPEPVLRELVGDWRGAVDGWRALEAPYEAALAALPGDDRGAREALGVLQALGARGAARAFTREREQAGGRVLRGPRRSTLVHPAGLTRREQEVLEQLATGATNAGIAAALHLSDRTVAHHVAAILRKLGVAGRSAAVEQARIRGLVATQDRQPRP